MRIHDGDTVSFRTDRPVRAGARGAGRTQPSRHAGRPADRQAERPSERLEERQEARQEARERHVDPAGRRAEEHGDRLARLEATVGKLEGSLARLTDLLQDVALKVEAVERRPDRPAARRSEPDHHPQPPGGEGRLSDTHPAGDVKVSMFGGDSIRAVVGEVRVRRAD